MSLRQFHSNPNTPTKPLVVGSIASAEALAYSSNYEECSIVEFRLDGLLQDLRKVREILIQLKDSPLQTLLTFRCSNEGGLSDLSLSQREALLQNLLPLADFIDIELQNISNMSDTIKLAKELGVVVIGSFHDFEKTPPLNKLKEKIESATDLEVDIIKIAVHLENEIKMVELTHLLSHQNNTPLSLMGMGKLGAVSRVLYAQFGSILNYGYLGDSPTAPNQWPASLLQEALKRTL